MKSKKSKPEIWWCVKDFDPKVGYLLRTVSRTKKESMNIFHYTTCGDVKCYCFDKNKYRCVKIKVEEC